MIAAAAVGIAIMLSAPPVKAQMIQNGIMECLSKEKNVWRGGCFEALSNRMMEEMPFEESMRTLAVLDDDQPIKSFCHALVHNLGQRAYQETKSLSDTFGRCRTTIACGEGCFHGAVEAYMAETGDALTDETLSKACSRDFSGNETNYMACNHGIGHAMMLLSGGELLPSLKSCDALGKLEERETCYDGVFMENVFSSGSADHPSKYLNPKDPTYPCTIVDERYRTSCYSGQASYVVYNTKERYEGATAFCAKLPEMYQPDCYESLGGDIIVETDDAQVVRGICERAPLGARRDKCYYGALEFDLYEKAGKPESLGDICRATDAESRATCFSNAGDVLEDWYPSDRAAQCARITADEGDLKACST